MSGHVPGGDFGYTVFHERVVFQGECEFQVPSRVPSKASTNVAAAGTTAADATVLHSTVNVIRSGAANAGVKLLPTDQEIVWVINATGVSIKVYPPAGYAYDGGDADTAVSVASGINLMFVLDATTSQAVRVSGVTTMPVGGSAGIPGVASVSGSAVQRALAAASIGGRGAITAVAA